MAVAGDRLTHRTPTPHDPAPRRTPSGTRREERPSTAAGRCPFRRRCTASRHNLSRRRTRSSLQRDPRVRKQPEPRGQDHRHLPSASSAARHFLYRSGGNGYPCGRGNDAYSDGWHSSAALSAISDSRPENRQAAECLNRPCADPLAVGNGGAMIRAARQATWHIGSIARRRRRKASAWRTKSGRRSQRRGLCAPGTRGTW